MGEGGELQAWRCAGGAALGDAAPAFPAPRRAAALLLAGCRAPPSRPYSELLRRLNVDTHRLRIASLSARSFDARLVDIPLTELSVHAERPIGLENDFAHLRETLERVSLERITLTTDQFMSLRNVVNLSLVETGLEEVPDLSRFGRLRWLALRERGLLRAPGLAAAPALRWLTLAAPDAALAAMPGLVGATFVGAYAMERVFGGCGALESLAVERGALRGLRAGLLEGCARLRRLSLARGALEAVPGALLAGAPGLTLLDLSHNRLRALPGGLLRRSGRLTRLDVSHNLLSALPAELFSHARSLSHLDLAHNRLSAVPAALLNGPMRLTHLNLAHNRLSVPPGRSWPSALPVAGGSTLNLGHNELKELPVGLLNELKLKGIKVKV